MPHNIKFITYGRLGNFQKLHKTFMTPNTFDARKSKHQINESTMDTEKDQNVPGTTQSLSERLLHLSPPPQYQTAGAQSTRMIIDSASYTTTPCSSPPNETSHVFSANDAHHKVPDDVALAEADNVLRQQIKQDEPATLQSKTPAKPDRSVIQRSIIEPGRATGDRNSHKQGIIPPYMLQAIARSEAAGDQARASAEQTLLSSKSMTHKQPTEGQ
jgi:hypothetical protein